MKPIKTGQVAKFHSPLPDEDPNQKYVILEVMEDDLKSRAKIKPLNTNLTFPPVNIVSLDDLEVVEVETSDLIGHKVTIRKSDYSFSTGKVIKVDEEKILLDLNKDVNRVETNVCLTIIDEDGNEQIGTLLVN